jgi:tetratricopeptide (TPR) repeat protein
VKRAILAVSVCLGTAAAQPGNSLAEAVARNNQALQLAGAGQDQEAERLFRAALDAARDDDLARAKIASNLASLYRDQDRYRDAERMYRSALQWRQKNLPATSLEVAYALNNLGEIYRVEGREWDARNLMERAAYSLQQFHPDAPGFPIVLSNLGMVLCQLGEFDRAELSLRAALAAYQPYSRPSREYGVTLTDLGWVLQARKQLQEAAPLYEQAVGILEKLGAPARMELAATLANQGDLYRRLDRPQEARQTEERALKLLSPPRDALLRSEILRNLGNIVAGGAKPADSVPYFEQSLKLEEKALGEEHLATASLLLDYASATQRAGDKSLARKLRKRASELIARLRTQSPSQLTVSLRDLRDSE